MNNGKAERSGLQENDQTNIRNDVITNFVERILSKRQIFVLTTKKGEQDEKKDSRFLDKHIDDVNYGRMCNSGNLDVQG